MSVGRTTETTEFNLTELEAAAKEMGLSVCYNSEVTGYYGKMKNSQCDLVVQTKSTYSIGFRNVEGKAEIVADHHGGHVDSTLKALIPNYYQRQIERNKRFKVIERTETKDHIVIRVRR